MDNALAEQILRTLSDMRSETQFAFTGLHTEVVGARAEVAGLCAEVADLRAEVAGLRNRLDKLEIEVASLRSDLYSTRSAIMDRIDRVQGTVDQLRSEMTVNWATADNAIRKARVNQDEVREVYDLFAAMQRQVQVLTERVNHLELRGPAPG